MKCPNCGTNNAKGAKFCEKCGNSLVETNICSKCGHKNKPTAKHCVECGTSLVRPTAETKTPTPSEEPAPITAKAKGKISPLVWVLAGVLGIILVCAGIFLLGLIRLPVPPQPDTSTLPQFIVSAWTGVYNFQTTGSFSLLGADTGSKYVEALFNCDEKKKSPIYATTGVRIHDYVSWMASTQQQVTDFQKNVKFDVYIDGVKAVFQGPFKYEVKQNEQKTGYVTPVLVVLGSQAAGTHHIRTEITWVQKIYDGESYYGPGGNTEKIVGNCTLVITPPSTGAAAGQPPADQAPVVVQPVQWGGCERNVSKAECEKDGGTWGGLFEQMLPNAILGERYCICKNDPQDPVKRDKTWCESQGGIWMEAHKGCSFMNPCAAIKDEVTCEARQGSIITDKEGAYTGVAGSTVCICPSFTKYPINSCSITNQITVSDMIYDSKTGHFRIEISQPTGFPADSYFDIKISKNNDQKGVFACQSSGINKMSCERDYVPSEAEDFTGADLNICRDVYCCVNLGKFDIKTQSGNLFTLTGNCPVSGDLSAAITEWKPNGALTMEIRNQLEWSVDTFTTDLKDAKGADWTTLTCKRKDNDPKLMVCTGMAVGKTGTGSLNFSYQGDSGKCNLQGLSFPIPCARPCRGTCCPQGYTCCDCGCRFLGTSGSCSSACS
jgi:ribosomal protein L40E